MRCGGSLWSMLGDGDGDGDDDGNGFLKPCS